MPALRARDRREFYVMGSARLAERPSLDAPAEAWDAYLHLRDNPAGPTRELWQHEAGCGAWIVVERDSVSHEIGGTSLAAAG